MNKRTREPKPTKHIQKASRASIESDDSETLTTLEFSSCLLEDSASDKDIISLRTESFVLRRALSIVELEDTSWLSSSVMNLAFEKFGRFYPQIHFMSIDFLLLNLSSTDSEPVYDILGVPIDFHDPSTQIVFIYNERNIHWNLIRVVLGPEPNLQLFEPMGKPSSRRVGLNYRSIPKSFVDWLNRVSPLKSKVSWLTVGISVITKQQQITSYDCGVACLLYAEKCGKGMSKEEINSETTQEEITQYRRTLQAFIRQNN